MSDDVYVCLKYYVDFVSTIVWSDTVFRCSVGYCVPMFGRILCSDVRSDTVFRCSVGYYVPMFRRILCSDSVVFVSFYSFILITFYYFAIMKAMEILFKVALNTIIQPGSEAFISLNWI